MLAVEVSRLGEEDPWLDLDIGAGGFAEKG